MKVEIDIEDILRDEYGDPDETIAASIMRQIVSSVTSELKGQIEEAIRNEINKHVSAAVSSTTAQKVEQIASELLDTGYTPVDRYGISNKETTLRAQLHKTLVEQCTFNKTSRSYDRNAYSNVVANAVDEKMKEFRSAFLEQVNGEFVSEALKHATSELKKKLKLN